MRALAEIFGWTHCDFWLNDHNGTLYHPVTNIGQDFIHEYQASLRGFDPLNARALGIDRAVDAVVVTDDDIADHEDFLKSKYGMFLARHGFHYEAAAYLKGQKRMIGTCALFRTPEEGPFDARDKAILREIAPIMARMLEMNINFDTASVMRLNLRHCVDISDMGLIFFGEEFHVAYANQTARRICEQLDSVAHVTSADEASEEGLGDDAGVVTAFLKHSFGGNPLRWVMGCHRTFMLPDFSSVELSLSLAPVGLSYKKDKRLFMVRLNRVKAPVVNDLGDDEPRPKLTFRKLQVVAAVVDGLNNQEIADKLFISVSAVKKHLSDIYRAEGVNSRLELVYKVMKAQQA
jgi:DNA-binding CsgD family transcriptional regulator